MESGNLRDARASTRKPIASASVRTGLRVDAIAAALIENLHCLQGKLPQHATRNDWYMALAHTVRDRMMERYVATLAIDCRNEYGRQGRRISVRRVPDRTTPG